MHSFRKYPNSFLALGVLLALACCAVPLRAQIQVGDNTHLNGTGSISLGYGGSVSQAGQEGSIESSASGHSLDAGGSASFEGYYFTPRFLSFTLSPYYNRSQTNSESQSITDASGLAGGVQVFSGSKTPGYINFSKSFNSSGTYGIPNLAGLTTHGNDRNFGIGWSALFPGLPSLHAMFEDSGGNSSVIGDTSNSHFGSRVFSVDSGYRYRGFDLATSYSHSWGQSHSEELFSEITNIQESSSSSDNFNVSVAHQLPLHGAFGAQFRHSGYTFDYTSTVNQSSSGGSNDYMGYVSIQPFTKLFLSANAEYTDDLIGGVERQSLDSSGTLVRTMAPRGSSGRRFSANAYSNVFKGLNANGYISHTEQSIAGETFGATQYGGGLTYTFAHNFVRGLSVNGGFVDTATQQGNGGMGFVGNVNYNTSLLGWALNAGYSYSQNVQTLLVIYTRSSMGYGVGARKKLPHGRYLMLGFSGGHSGITGQSGTLSHNESYYTQLNTRRFSLSGTYNNSYGQSVFTTAGLISLPTQLPTELISPEDIVTYSGKSYSVGSSTTLFRRLSLSASYSRGLSDSHSLTNSFSAFTDRGFFRFHYRLRKITIDGGYSRLWQDTHNQISTHSVVNSYYIGISRWFNFF